jgi:ribose/xylose/arabinose/galactoside ABC-type transport system permease subunit
MDKTSQRPSILLDSLTRLFRHSEWGLVIAIFAVLIVAAIVDKQHTYWTRPGPSAVDILRQSSMLGIFALGAAIVIISGGIDLSSGSVIALSGTTCATLMLLLSPDSFDPSKEIPLGSTIIALAIAGTLLVGFLIGTLHAWLITVVGLPPFVATLATLVGLRSFARALVGPVTTLVYKDPSSQIQLADTQFLELTKSVPLRVAIFLALAALAWLLLSRTVTGRRLYALGGNETAARLSGIQTDRLKWLAYCISAILSSIAGILYIGDQSVADPQTLGQGYELNAIAAAVVGGCSLQGGAGTITGTILGVLFLRTVIDGVAKMIKSDADVYEGFIVGVVVVAAVAFNQVRQTGQRGKKFFSGTLGIITILTLGLLMGVLGVIIGNVAKISSTRMGLGAGALTLMVLMVVRYLEKRPAKLPIQG